MCDNNPSANNTNQKKTPVGSAKGNVQQRVQRKSKMNLMVAPTESEETNRQREKLAKRLKKSLDTPLSKIVPPKISGPLGNMRYIKDGDYWTARNGGGMSATCDIVGKVKIFLLAIGNLVTCVDFHPRHRLCDCLHQFRNKKLTDELAQTLVERYFCLSAEEKIIYVSSDVKRNLEMSSYSCTDETLSNLDRSYNLPFSTKKTIKSMCIYGYLWVFHIRKFNYKNFISKIVVQQDNHAQLNSKETPVTPTTNSTTIATAYEALPTLPIVPFKCSDTLLRDDSTTITTTTKNTTSDAAGPHLHFDSVDLQNTDDSRPLINAISTQNISSTVTAATGALAEELSAVFGDEGGSMKMAEALPAVGVVEGRFERIGISGDMNEITTQNITSPVEELADIGVAQGVLTTVGGVAEGSFRSIGILEDTINNPTETSLAVASSAPETTTNQSNTTKTTADESPQAPHVKYPINVRIYELNKYGNYAVWTGTQLSDISDNGDVIIQYDSTYPRKTINLIHKREGKYTHKIIEENLLKMKRREAQEKKRHQKNQVIVNFRHPLFSDWGKMYIIEQIASLMPKERIQMDSRFQLQNNIIYDPTQAPEKITYTKNKCASCNGNNKDVCQNHVANKRAGYICKKGDCHNQDCGKDKLINTLHDDTHHYMTKCNVFNSGTAANPSYGVQYHVPGIRNVILKDSIIGEYCGEIISEKEQHKRETNDQFEYTLELSEFIQYDDSIHKETKWYVDANNFGNLTRFINHSCKPNCEYRAYMVDGYLRCFVVALRRIRQTEELTCKYTDQNSLWFECMCSVHVRKKTSTNNI